MKSRHSNCCFALRTHTEVRNKPLEFKTCSHKPAQTYSNKVVAQLMGSQKGESRHVVRF